MLHYERTEFLELSFITFIYWSFIMITDCCKVLFFTISALSYIDSYSEIICDFINKISLYINFIVLDTHINNWIKALSGARQSNMLLVPLVFSYMWLGRPITINARYMIQNGMVLTRRYEGKFRSTPRGLWSIHFGYRHTAPIIVVNIFRIHWSDSCGVDFPLEVTTK